MGRNDFEKGMVAGAKPFEEKFRQMENSFDEFTKDFRKNHEEEYKQQEKINDLFDKRLNDLEKKKLFDLNTTHDIKDEEVLEKAEQEYLVGYLITCANQLLGEVNRNQKKFIRSVSRYLEITVRHSNVDLTLVKNISKNFGVQAFLQTVMEFFFLEQENFAFIDEYEALLSYYPVSSRITNEMMEHIQNVYNAVGAEGIAEKYGFEPVIEKKVVDTKEEEIVIPYYDGNDICKACADWVNRHDYVELDKYLICFNQSKNAIYKVEKTSGKRQVVDLSKYADTYSLSNNDYVCGWKKWLYFVNLKKEYEIAIYRYNVETNIVEKIENISEKVYGIYANDQYVVYKTSEMSKHREILCCHYLNEKRTDIFRWKTEEGDMVVPNNFYLLDDIIYFTTNDEFYLYNINEKKLQLLQQGLDCRNGNEYSFLTKSYTQYYKGILYSIVNIDYYGHNMWHYIDINNPTSIKRFKLPNYGKTCYWAAYGKVYYVTCDENAEFGYYDVLTKEQVVIKRNTSLVEKYRNGILNMKTNYLPPTGNIVGKWFYVDKSSNIQCISLEDMQK